MDINELELTNGLFYQKSSDKPFTGKVSGKEDSLWVYFNQDGSLNKTETYKDGKLVEWEH